MILGVLRHPFHSLVAERRKRVDIEGTADAQDAMGGNAATRHHAPLEVAECSKINRGVPVGIWLGQLPLLVYV